MFILSDLNGVEPKIQNTSLSDEAAELLIDEAVLQAGIEVRNRCRQLRQNELSHMADKAERDAAQEITSANERQRLNREREAGRITGAKLAAAEGATFRPAPNA